MTPQPWVVPLTGLGMSDVATVGGKNASLGEMITRLSGRGIRVPGGFAVTSAAYWSFVDGNGLRGVIESFGNDLSFSPQRLQSAGAELREALAGATIGAELGTEIRAGYARLCAEVGEKLGAEPGAEPAVSDVPVAVRSSATAEDLPEASFAGQQESFLNVSGAEAILDAYHRCVVSLFGDRAIAYREEHGFSHLDVALSVGVQYMVRSDLAGAGVMFTIDPESGYGDIVMIDAAWGLGEAVVKGEVEPDRYQVKKSLLGNPTLTPILSRDRGAKLIKIVNSDTTGSETAGSDTAGSETAGTDTASSDTATIETSSDERSRLVLSDREICELGRWAVLIEDHYGRPMDIEWAKDGLSGDLYIVQARPETVQAQRDVATFVNYSLADLGEVLVTGLAVGGGVGSGPVRRLRSPAEGADFAAGSVLVTDTTDPDWVPILRRAAAVITDRGGRTSHAAIVSRELGVPAIVGARDATSRLSDDRLVTVSCATGETGRVHDGIATVTTETVEVSDLPTTRTKVMVNLANPEAALSWWQLPADGIGLMRMEFIISEHIAAHPMALAHPDRIEDPQVRFAVEALAGRFDSPAAFFVDQLASGIARLAAPWFPRPVIVRMSDFKTNEYRSLLGGEQFEPIEANPMLGWRGASRYDHPGYRDGFALECAAINKVRAEIGLDNVVVMIPFCRTPEEADRVLAEMARHGLQRGERGLEVYVMAEIPSNIIRADEFAERFDGFSIGSNDLTQLTLGVDRDSELLAASYGADDPAVLQLIDQLIERAHRAGLPVGFCGQAPSNDPTYAQRLVAAGIDSISVTPDTFFAVKRHVAEAEHVS